VICILLVWGDGSAFISIGQVAIGLMSVMILIQTVFGYKIKHKVMDMITCLLLTAAPFVLARSGVENNIVLMSSVYGSFATIILVFLLGIETRWWKRILLFLSGCCLVGMIITIFFSIIGLALGRVNALCQISAFICALGYVGCLGGLIKLTAKKQTYSLPLSVIVMISGFCYIVYKLFFSYILVTDDMLKMNISDRYDVVTVEIVFLLLIFGGVILIKNVYLGRYYQQLVNVSANSMEAQKKYYETLEQRDVLVRGIRHDMNNHLSVLNLLLENGQVDQAKDYIVEISENIRETDIGVHTGNSIVNAIIMDKMSVAKEKGVSIIVNGVWNYEKMQSVDICTILANILDNAIEAVDDKLSDTNIVLDLKCTDQFFMISESNRCSRKPIMEDDKLITTKKDKSIHGFGIENIRNAVAKYQGTVELTCEKAQDFDNEFIFTIDILIGS